MSKTIRKRGNGLIAAVLLGMLLLQPSPDSSPQAAPSALPTTQTLPATTGTTSSKASQIASAVGKLPLRFEANMGQTDPRVAFLARGSGYTVFLTADEAVMELNPASPSNPIQSNDRPNRKAA